MQPSVGPESVLKCYSGYIGCAWYRWLCTELAGKKELMNYQMFIAEHSKQLKGIEDLLDETLGDAWDFTLDPIALQVCVCVWLKCGIRGVSSNFKVMRLGFNQVSDS